MAERFGANGLPLQKKVVTVDDLPQAKPEVVVEPVVEEVVEQEEDNTCPVCGEDPCVCDADGEEE